MMELNIRIEPKYLPATRQIPLSRFDSRATHARTLQPAALAFVPYGFVLVRVRVPGTKSLQSQRATKLLQSSPVEAGSPLPVLKSEAGVDYTYSRTTDAAAHSPDSACTNAVVEAPANLWNLTVKMVGEAFCLVEMATVASVVWRRQRWICGRSPSRSDPS